MFVWCVFTLMLLGLESRAFTHRSGVIANGKPILRSISQDSQESRSKPSDESLAAKEPDWFNQLRKNIFAINRHGFKKAKPTESFTSSQEGVQSIQHKLPQDAENVTNTLMNIGGLVDSNWLSDLKTYIQQLVTTYGAQDIDSRLSSVIKSIQRNNDVIINDVDVNERGDVFVDYTFLMKLKKITTKAREAYKLHKVTKNIKNGRSVTVSLDADSD